jgi:Plasma-membrane choline transporter
MSSHIPIVQGIAVQPDGSSKYQTSYSSYDQGVAQPNHAVPTSYDGVSPQELQQMRATPIKQYQDVIWAVLFIAHLIAVVVVVLLEFSSSTVQGTSLQGNIIFLTCTTGLAAVGLSSMALSFMMQHAKPLVEMALIFSVASSLAVGIMGFMFGSILMGCLGLLSFVVGCCYAKLVWPRIPFAAANLNTALSAVRENLGLTVVSFGFTAIAFGWTIFWFLGVGNSLAGNNGAVVFLLVRCNS